MRDVSSRKTTYANLHKWPVAEVDFSRSLSSGCSNRSTSVVDSISYRQMYHRGYTFSRKEENKDVRGDLDGHHDAKRKKTVQINMRESKTLPHRASVGRLVKKCLSCACSTKFNILKNKVYQQRQQ
uniref:Uncharacterized protein n=1 Tax=Brassica campestris TaxID=3711 RepID=A0A3P5YTT8_BRACM|nr:unnamed protein product [Brassica rapa]